MTQLSLKRGLACWITVTAAATLLVVVGLWGQHIDPHSHGQGIVVKNAAFWLLGPGYFVAALLAALFLPGGGHSVGDLFWLGAPVSWIFYFVVGVLIFCVQWKE